MSRIAIFFLLIVSPILAVLLAYLGFQSLQSNLIGWFLFLTGSTYAVCFILIPILRYQQIKNKIREIQRSSNFKKEEKGDVSFWFITLGVSIVFFISPLEFLYFRLLPIRTTWLEFIGTGLILSGIFLFFWARLTLGAYYSGHIHIKEEQELVQKGPYQIIRHPAYAGYLLMALGIVMGYSSLTGMGAILFIMLPAIIYRIRVEDRFLAEYFCEEFKAYSKKRKRLLPGIW